MAVSGAASHRAPARAAAAISNSVAKCFRRFQLSPDRRHAAAFSCWRIPCIRCTSSSKLSSCLQQPAYASIFPLGQGLILAIGWTLFGHPWAGVALSIGALCALCYWMLRAWTTPGWALVGGLLAVIEFGPLSQWMNSYWGGAGAACAGCLVFGALAEAARRGSRALTRRSWGWGLGLHWLCRPYETIFLITKRCIVSSAKLALDGEAGSHAPQSLCSRPSESRCCKTSR